MGSELMSRVDPFCKFREPEDAKFAVDHFYGKLLRLENTMKTTASRALATERTDFLRKFLEQLRREVPS